MYITAQCHWSTPGLQSNPKGRCPLTVSCAWVHLENEHMLNVEYKTVFYAMQCLFAFW